MSYSDQDQIMRNALEQIANESTRNLGTARIIARGALAQILIMTAGRDGLTHRVAELEAENTRLSNTQSNRPSSSRNR